MGQRRLSDFHWLPPIGGVSREGGSWGMFGMENDFPNSINTVHCNMQCCINVAFGTSLQDLNKKNFINSSFPLVILNVILAGL